MIDRVLPVVWIKTEDGSYRCPYKTFTIVVTPSRGKARWSVKSGRNQIAEGYSDSLEQAQIESLFWVSAFTLTTKQLWKGLADE